MVTDDMRTIPVNWDYKRFKYCAQICNGAEYAGIEVDEGGYPVIGSGGEFARASKFSYQGESVLLGRKGTIDKPLYINDAFWCVDTMFYTRIMPSMVARYLYYCALCFKFDYYVTSTALPSMTQRDLGSEKVMVPPRSEQQVIADFLDKECTRIDSIISDLERQIETLKQYKKSLITETVTKGLDKSVPMKDSGIAWIGEMPLHWKCKKLGYMANVTKLAGFEFTDYFEYVDEGVIAIRGLNLKNFHLNLDDVQHIPVNTSDMLPRSQIHENDVLISYAGTVGAIGLIEDDGNRYETNIAQKVEIIIEHFKNNIMKELGGKAKAMVVTSSRQAAVKYRNEFVDYVTRHGYTGIHALVAFSGKVSLDGKEYTEVVMNGISEEDLPEVFGTDSYQVLLVANKYQTGFDQPKLCAMYVDKRLRGVAAVQTLSRLNRICAPYNKKTFVLDFKNTYEDIQNAFAPYYTETVLNETITPSDIRAVEAQVDQYGFLDLDDIDTFNEYLYQEKRTAKDKAKMWSLLDKSLQIINKFSVLEKMEIRATIKRFIRFYSFLIQATCFESIDLHKKYNFLTYLVKEIEIGGGGNDFDIADKITASNFKQKKTGEETTQIESKPEVNLPKPNEVYFDEAAKKKLSEIIEEINAAYNKNLDVDVASKSALQMRDLLLKNGHLRDSARNNSLKDFRFAYFDAVQDALLEGFEQNQEFYTLLLDNDEKKRELMQVFLEDIYKKLRE